MSGVALVQAAVLYFALTYTAGFAFGTVRELFLTPKFGQLTATLIETPAMLLVTFFAARWIVSHFGPGLGASDLLSIGALAFTLLILAEIVFAGLLRKWSPADWINHLRTPDGAISLGMFVLFGLMPWLTSLKDQP